MAIPEELRRALRNMRDVRGQKPKGGEMSVEFAAWREKMAEALDLIGDHMIFEEDRIRARQEAATARAQAARIRSALRRESA